jgi:hypothetical protein
VAQKRRRDEDNDASDDGDAYVGRAGGSRRISKKEGMVQVLYSDSHKAMPLRDHEINTYARAVMVAVIQLGDTGAIQRPTQIVRNNKMNDLFNGGVQKRGYLLQYFASPLMLGRASSINTASVL